jgi:hypothetical protein
MSSPTSRTLDRLKKHGYHASVVERYVAPCRQRFDCFGFGDVAAIRRDQPGVLLIQATSGSNLAARVSKIMDLEAAKDFLLSGNRIECWGWVKKGKQGARKLWAVNVRRIVYADLNWEVSDESELEINAPPTPLAAGR